MKSALFLVAGVLVAVSSAIAQPPPAGQQLTLSASLTRGYNAVKQNLTEEAAKMAEADYGFKPAQQQSSARSVSCSGMWRTRSSGRAPPRLGSRIRTRATIWRRN